MNDRFQQFVSGQRPAATPQLVKQGEPEADDVAQPAGYEAVRRIRSFSFADVVFRSHNGAAQAFPAYALRTWLADGAGRRLTLIWPEGEVLMTGRHLNLIEEDLMRRIVAEFRQVAPSAADAVPAAVPVIETLDIRPLGAADS